MKFIMKYGIHIRWNLKMLYAIATCTWFLCFKKKILVYLFSNLATCMVRWNLLNMISQSIIDALKFAEFSDLVAIHYEAISFPFCRNCRTQVIPNDEKSGCKFFFMACIQIAHCWLHTRGNISLHQPPWRVTTITTK